jgi:hypothetical protein
MAKSYDIEVPSIAQTQLTGLALIVRDTIRGVTWEMHCDNCGRPLAIRRNGVPYPTMINALLPMHRFAARFLLAVCSLR